MHSCTLGMGLKSHYFFWRTGRTSHLRYLPPSSFYPFPHFSSDFSLHSLAASLKVVLTRLTSLLAKGLLQLCQMNPFCPQQSSFLHATSAVQQDDCSQDVFALAQASPFSWLSGSRITSPRLLLHCPAQGFPCHWCHWCPHGWAAKDNNSKGWRKSSSLSATSQTWTPGNQQIF